MTKTLEPSELLPEIDVEPEGARDAAAADKQALAELVAPVRGRTRLAMGLQVVASAATIAPYVAIAELGKTLLTDAAVDEHRAWIVVWCTVIALGVRAGFGGAALMITHFADVRLQALLRRRIVAVLGTLPLGWFSRNSSGLVRKAAQNDIDDLHYLVAHRDVETLAAVATPLFALGYVIWIDWRLALLAVLALPIYAVLYGFMTRGMAEKMREMNTGIARISATIVEFVNGISVVKAYGRTGQAHSRFRDAAIDFGEFYAGWVRPMLRTEAIGSMVLSAPVVLVVNLIGGIAMVQAGWVSVIDALTATLVAMALPATVITLGFGMQARREAAAAAGRLSALLNTPPLPTPDRALEPVGHEVVFDSVSFAYDERTPALSEIELTLRPGTITALVGASGSGKSTLATLLPRFHDPDAGAVRIGGVDVREIAPETLYRQVGFVLQEVQLLSVSVLDNIRLARPEASLEQVRAAARAACVDERVQGLPRGYDSVVGVDALLSGGEAQRVSIARALLADTPILVLDEATAHADPESEADIQQALSALAVGRTLLVIAHRLDTIVGADQIVVLDRGRIAEQGTHDQLLAAAGLYARMWRHHHLGGDHL
ncbi:ABC transporter ATP-binding protein [Nocardia sp. NPDC058058]|uniref:ABC transporter ATP-binding protein n=1 Tax=Nocardia sp. NPDC058058 TaxID=3346317 RepID=UPI0036DB675F